MKATRKTKMIKDHGSDNVNQIHQDNIPTITEQCQQTEGLQENNGESTATPRNPTMLDLEQVEEKEPTPSASKEKEMQKTTKKRRKQGPRS